MRADANLLSSGRYLDWGVVQISLTNFLIIVGMIVLFVIALLAPFPGARERDGSAPRDVQGAPDDDH